MSHPDFHQIVAEGKNILSTEISGLQSVHDSLGENFAKAVTALFACTGRVVVSGMGKSGLIGRKISATLNSTGTPSYFLHPAEAAHGDLGLLQPDDMVLAISNSGKTDELLGIVPLIRQRGIGVIALIGSRHSPMGEAADLTLEIGQHKEAGSLSLAPTTSTTVTLAIGDALALCLAKLRRFTSSQFKIFHPGGSLGQRLALRVSDLMRQTHLPVVPEAKSIRDCLETLESGGMNAVLAINAQGRLIGMFTDGDFRRLASAGNFDLDQAIATVVTRDLTSAGPDDLISDLLNLMENKIITVIPIVDEQRVLLGALHIHDILGKGAIKF